MHQSKVESESKFFFKHNFQSEIRVDTNENMCTKNKKILFFRVSSLDMLVTVKLSKYNM